MGNRTPIFIESFLLQARNLHLFIPIFLLIVAYTTLSTLGYSTVVEPLLIEVFNHAAEFRFSGYFDPSWTGYADLIAEARTRAGHLVAASTAYLLITAFTVGPAIGAITVSAAVTACRSGERGSSSFYALGERKLLAGARMKGPFGTALLGHILQAVVVRGVILVFELYTAFYLRYASHVLLIMDFLLGHIFALYMEVVCTMAVVVSAAEQAGCFYGVRALWQAWRIMAEKTTPAVIHVFAKAAVTAIMEAMSIRVNRYPIQYYYNMTTAYSVLPGFVYSTFYAALQLWFVCATTIYYYQCRQRKDGYYSI